METVMDDCSTGFIFAVFTNLKLETHKYMQYICINDATQNIEFLKNSADRGPSGCLMALGSNNFTSVQAKRMREYEDMEKVARGNRIKLTMTNSSLVA